MKKIVFALIAFLSISFAPTDCYIQFTEDDEIWLVLGCVKNGEALLNQVMQESPAIKAYLEENRGKTIGIDDEHVRMHEVIALCEQELVNNPLLQAKVMSMLWYFQVISLYKAHEYEQANAILDKALSWYPQNPLVHFGKSRVYEKLGDTQQAQYHAQQAAQLGFDFTTIKEEPIQFDL